MLETLNNGIADLYSSNTKAETNMREYILTEKERQIIKRYIETGEKLEGFKIILHRARNMQIVNSDLELIKTLLSKVQEQK